MITKALLWLQWAIKRLTAWRHHGRGLPQLTTDGFENPELTGYPNNHNYLVDDGRLIPNFNLFWRWKILSKLYSEPMGSLLDVGSCKGWFVFDAVTRGRCTKAVGIDIFEPFIELAEKVRINQGIETAKFHTVFIRDVCNNPEKYGAPFKNILIINTYHYLFWGSNLSSERFESHEEAMAGLERICADRIIFANPLSLADAPRETNDIASAEPERQLEYTPEKFLHAASKHFFIEDHGTIGKRNLLVLKRRN